MGQNEVVKQLLLNEFHGSFADGRIGVEVTRRRLSNYFFWMGMKRDV